MHVSKSGNAAINQPKAPSSLSFRVHKPDHGLSFNLALATFLSLYQHKKENKLIAQKTERGKNQMGEIVIGYIVHWHSLHRMNQNEIQHRIIRSSYFHIFTSVLFTLM